MGSYQNLPQFPMVRNLPTFCKTVNPINSYSLWPIHCNTPSRDPHVNPARAYPPGHT